MVGLRQLLDVQEPVDQRIVVVPPHADLQHVEDDLSVLRSFLSHELWRPPESARAPARESARARSRVGRERRPGADGSCPSARSRPARAVRGPAATWRAPQSPSRYRDAQPLPPAVGNSTSTSLVRFAMSMATRRAPSRYPPARSWSVSSLMGRWLSHPRSETHDHDQPSAGRELQPEAHAPQYYGLELTGRALDLWAYGRAHQDRCLAPRLQRRAAPQRTRNRTPTEFAAQAGASL